MRRRGFTLAEMVVYMGLVTTGIAVLGGIELSAQRATVLQQAVLDVERDSATFLTYFRRDVEAARKVDLSKAEKGSKLVVTRGDGVQVTYQAGERIVRTAAGKVEGRMTFPDMSLMVVERKGPGLRATCTFTKKLGWRDELTRKYWRTAAPRTVRLK